MNTFRRTFVKHKVTCDLQVVALQMFELKEELIGEQRVLITTNNTIQCWIFNKQTQ